MRGEPLTVYDGGAVRRDFTYIDDIVAGVVGCLDHPPDPVLEPPSRLFNIGNTRSEAVGELIRLLEVALGRSAVLVDAPRPAADARETLADVEALRELTGFAPQVPLAEGVSRFATWFLGWRAN